MISYIASNSMDRLIKSICQEQHITILNQEVEEIDFLKYIKQTKVNFNLIKYFIIDINQLKNTEDEIVNSIKYFKEMYSNTRIIIIAKGYDSQNNILTALYENGIYNIANNNEEQELKQEIKNCLTQGLQEKDAKKFKRIEKIKIDKKAKYKNLILKLKGKNKKQPNEQELKERTQKQISSSVYFLAIFVDVVKSLVRLLCYIAVFILTSVGLTFLLNEELRNMVFQIFNH